jgi:predicted ATPase
MTGGKRLPSKLVDQIVTKTDGVPLFVEELTKAVLESGVVRDEGECYVLAGPLRGLAIPSTLQDSLMARLDRLDTGKEVAQVGAAIGREFLHRLLAAALASFKGDELEAALARLVAAELIFRKGTPPNAIYRFKHALVQDTAYNSLLKARRHQLHREIATLLEEEFPQTGETEPELLAHHYQQAGLPEKAIPYGLRAGNAAVVAAIWPGRSSFPDMFSPQKVTLTAQRPPLAPPGRCSGRWECRAVWQRRRLH